MYDTVPSREYILSAIKKNADRLGLGAVIGLLVALLDYRVLFSRGIPVGGDVLSSLLPALYFRAAVRTGSEVLTTPIYGGMEVWMNSFFKGFYPAWTPLFIPGVPLGPYLKILIVSHALLAGIISYWYASKHFETLVAVIITFTSVAPLAFPTGHISRVIVWPWMLLATWELLALRSGSPGKRAPVLIGLSGGLTLLTGNSYYAFYLAVLAGVVFISTKSFRSAFIAGITSIVCSSPKLLSLLMIVAEGGRSATVGYPLTIKKLITGLTGLWPSASGISVGTASYNAYGVLGPGIVVFAGIAVFWAYVRPSKFDSSWMTGVSFAGLLGLMLGTRSPLLMQLPLVGQLRTASRSLVLIALVVLLLAVVFLEKIDLSQSRIRVGVLSLLIVSATVAGAVPAMQDYETSVEPDVGREVATTLATHGCDQVWQEMQRGDYKGPYKKQVAFGIAEKGIPATAISYARIGQSYSTHDESGDLTFDAIVYPAGTEMNESGTISLTGGWGKPVRGEIRAERFGLVDSVKTDSGPIRIYALDGTCSSE